MGKVKMGELGGKGEVLTSPQNECAIPGYLLPIVMYNVLMLFLII